MLEDVKEFSDKFGQKANKTPGFLPDEVMKARLDFQLEELLETAHAAGFYYNREENEFKRAGRSREYAEGLKPDLAEVLDGLVDQLYVALGTAYLMGFGKEITTVGMPIGHPLFDEVFCDDTLFSLAWRRVHAANMKKEIVPGMYKIQKPRGWVRPDLSDLVK